jgi:uncharacterized membrane protein HdeD (DUF308 family)
MVIGAIVVAVGIIALLVTTDTVSGSIWQYTWPTVLIIIGISFIISRFRHSRWWWFNPPWHYRDRDKNDKE